VDKFQNLISFPDWYRPVFKSGEDDSWRPQTDKHNQTNYTQQHAGLGVSFHEISARSQQTPSNTQVTSAEAQVIACQANNISVTGTYISHSINKLPQVGHISLSRNMKHKNQDPPGLQ